MNRTDYTIEEEKDGMIVEKYLMEYSEEEVQANKINRDNAGLVYSPEFIPYYLEEVKAFGLSHIAGLLYGFIRFYLSGKEKKRFWFTNSQLTEIVNTSESTVKRCMRELSDRGLIETRRKVKTGGGTLRFINKVVTLSEVSKMNLQKDQKGYLLYKENKNKENKNNVPLKKLEVVEKKFGLSKKQIEEWFEFKKPIDRIIELCETIQAISEYINATPIYTKDTINQTDMALKEYTLEEVLAYVEDCTHITFDSYEDFVRCDYYLLHNLNLFYGN